MRTIALCFLAVILSFDLAPAQALQVSSPQYNEEVCLGATLPVTFRVTNNDSVKRSLVTTVEIRNVATNFVVYGASDTVRNLLPGTSADRSLPDYATDTSQPLQLGTFFACTKLIAIDQEDIVIQNWSFSDTICTPFFGMRMMKRPFIDHNNDYGVASFGDIPDQTKWVSTGASVVDGQYVTWDPPPPLARPYDTIGIGPHNLRAPIVKLDRLDWNGNPYMGTRVGDTITSFPINLAGVPTTFGGRREVILSFDYQRAGKTSYPLHWDKMVLFGPEQLVYNAEAKVVRPADSLIIEFKDTATSTCNPQKWNRIAALPGGRDFDFDNFWVLIPTGTKYYDSTFRFRIILKASDNSVGPTARDDADPWYLDNITVRAQARKTWEMEAMWARVVTPYTKLPFTATRALPVYMKLKNMSRDIAISFPVYVSILNDRGDTVYAKIQTITSFPTGKDTIIRFPDWDARTAVGTSSNFFVYGRIRYSNADTYPIDDTTYSTFYLNASADSLAVQEFALDDAGMNPVAGHGNDIPLLTKIPNTGIGFNGTNGSYAVRFPLLKNEDTLFGARIYFASANSATDPIRIAVHDGHIMYNACLPGDTLATFIAMRRPTNEFSTYLFPKPVVLAGGSYYWLSVTQLSNDNFMLGGDISRGGAAINVADTGLPRLSLIYSAHGTQASPTENTGDLGCMFAVQADGTGDWQQWWLHVGWWLTHSGSYYPHAVKIAPQMNAPFIGAGTYFPMIRPMVGSVTLIPSLPPPPPPPPPPGSVTSTSPVQLSFECSPNPFNVQSGVAQFHFTLPERERVVLTIFDAIGREVRTLTNGALEQGPHTVHWNGRDGTNKFVPTGTYICRLTTRTHTESINIFITN